MKQSEIPTSIHPWQRLADWFVREQRVLPWRENPSPYRVWISEIMLQQTQVATVLPYFERFVNRFPNVETLASADEADVLLHWAGLGYYSRARNIHRAAKLIVNQGAFPQTRESWLEIPGVGPYTAGAILSIALNQIEALLDGNVERVLSRFRCIPRDLSGASPYRDRLWRASERALQGAVEEFSIEPRVFNQALMELGARVCTPKKPACFICPLKSHCKSHLQGVALSFPSAKPKKKWAQVHEEHVLFFHEKSGLVAVAQAPMGAWRAGLWDLPSSESSRQFLGQAEGLREQSETYEIRTVVTQHKITRKIRVVLCTTDQGSIPLAWKWVNPESPEIALGSAFKKSWKAVRPTLFEVPSK